MRIDNSKSIFFGSTVALPKGSSLVSVATPPPTHLTHHCEWLKHLRFLVDFSLSLLLFGVFLDLTDYQSEFLMVLFHSKQPYQNSSSQTCQTIERFEYSLKFELFQSLESVFNGNESGFIEVNALEYSWRPVSCLLTIHLLNEVLLNEQIWAVETLSKYSFAGVAASGMPSQSVKTLNQFELSISIKWLFALKFILQIFHHFPFICLQSLDYKLFQFSVQVFTVLLPRLKHAFLLTERPKAKCSSF